MPSDTPVLVATDSFKGTFAAKDVVHLIAEGLRGAGRGAVELPLGDGGEGTMEAIVAARGGEIRGAQGTDPLRRSVTARYGVRGDGTAVGGTAGAGGLSRPAGSE